MFMNKILYTNEFLESVRSFAILGYSAEKIIDLTDPQNPEQFRIDFNTPGSEVYRAYRKGKTTGDYTLDKALFDEAKISTSTNTVLTERKHKQHITDSIFERFGI
jgi:hypothetical protein